MEREPMPSFDYHSFPLLGTQQVFNKSMLDECYQEEKNEEQNIINLGPVKENQLTDFKVNLKTIKN